MLQPISSPLEQTLIFAVLFTIIFLLFVRRKREPLTFSLGVTSELKGFAILTIILGHIGYFLFTDHNFLYPFSTISGVGVDLFLLLSGYGLAISSIKKNYKPWEFYKRRIGKIFAPLWLTLIIFFGLDWLLLNHLYDWQVIVKSFLGIYPQADIYLDLNSPLWYLTLLLAYYLIFPWVFRTRWPIFSAVILAVISYGLLLLPLPVTDGVRNLYSLHTLAFPLGVLFAGLMQPLQNFTNKITNWNKWDKLLKLIKPVESAHILRIARYIFLIILLGIFFYSSTAGGNRLIAELMSLVSATSITLIFIGIKLKFRFLEILGNYSYEIYLLHWPILYHYDFLYRFFPAGISTILYLGVLLGLGYLFQKALSISWGKQKKTV